MKKIVSALLTFTMLLTALCLFTACGNETDSGAVKAVITVKDFGDITLELDAENAPLTVEHFIKLCNEKAYDGSYFIRMQAGFVLQGGDGCTDTSTVKGEFTSNGVNNQLQHKKGVISMARSTDPDSGSCQFFLVLDDAAQASLDGSYAGFGRVVDGWDVVEDICNSITYDDFYPDYYYGYYMGFLQESSYIQIESIRIVK